MARTWLALFLVALALRPQIVVVGPLLPPIQADLAISHAVAGLLATIPVLCMGVFALAGPWLGRLVGTERAIAAGIAAIALFGLLRALAPEAVSMLVLTFGVGVGIAVIGPLLPIVVHARAPRRAAVATGAYAGGIVVGATAAAGLAVPLAGAGLDWRVPLSAFSLATVGSLAAWLLIDRRRKPADAGSRDGVNEAAQSLPITPRLPWRRRRAWALALLFGGQSILFYAAISWLPSIYIERGWTPADAGLLVALMNGVGLIANFGAPALSERGRSRRGQLVLFAFASLAGVTGIAALPELTLVWIVLLGLGLGAVFPLALTLPVDMADRSHQAGGIAAIMLFGGYLISSVAPFLLGVLRDATGSFDASLWAVVAVAVGLVAACWFFVPARRGPASDAAV
ncbi:MAG TPA: MFS transporter [Candidatus Limnocylindria bacterium]|nr:MFS transporter [Candidatus Limnocylindria bacterium]